MPDPAINLESHIHDRNKKYRKLCLDPRGHEWEDHPTKGMKKRMGKIITKKPNPGETE